VAVVVVPGVVVAERAVAGEEVGDEL